MKTILTLLAGLALTFGTMKANAQDLAAQAEAQTQVMASTIKLNAVEYKKLKALNFNRLAQIASLANLREQDNRYLDIRLDLIEEEYHSKLFNLLNPKQYSAFMNYKKDQPYTYAGVTNKNNPNPNKMQTIAIQTEE